MKYRRLHKPQQLRFTPQPESTPLWEGFITAVVGVPKAILRAAGNCFLGLLIMWDQGNQVLKAGIGLDGRTSR